MFAEAFAEIAREISAEFGGPYHPATAHWPGAPVLDAGGSIVSAGSPLAVTCRVQVDAATEAMRQAEGFIETDVRLLVLEIDVLDTAAEIVVSDGPGSGRYSIQSVAREPAGFGWECRGRRIA